MVKYTEVKLDKTRNLRYGMAALIKIEKALGISFSKIDFENLNYSDIAVIIHAGLQHEDKDLTVDSVVCLIDDYSDIKTVMAKMGEAMTSSFGEQDPNAVGTVKKAQAGTGNPL